MLDPFSLSLYLAPCNNPQIYGTVLMEYVLSADPIDAADTVSVAKGVYAARWIIFVALCFWWVHVVDMAGSIWMYVPSVPSFLRSFLLFVSCTSLTFNWLVEFG